MTPDIDNPGLSFSLRIRRALGFIIKPLLVPILLIAPMLAASSPPPLRISLESLGIQPLNAALGLGPVSPTTVNFVDEQHILVTYGVRRLMKRLHDDPPEDQDNMVAAALVDLRTAKVLARSEWRVHDYARYLWPLGHGNFLFRNQSTFTTFAPLANLSGGSPFKETSFLVSERRIAAVVLSSEADFLTIETVAPPKPRPVMHRSPMADFNAAISPGSNAGPGPEPQPTEGPELQSLPTPVVQIVFYRLSYPENGRVIPRLAGRAVSDRPVTVPATSTGYISAAKDGQNSWALDYNTYTGKVYELPLYDSTCQPISMMISKSEILAYGCHGKENQRHFAAFNLRGEEMWQKNFYELSPVPVLAFAPGTGRFAINRLIVTSANPDENLNELARERASTQTVEVYQTASGKQLAHVTASPVETTSQNFSLSPDGMGLAIVNNGAIEVYELPEPTAKEQSANKLALAAAPEEVDIPVRLGAPQAKTTSPPAPAGSSAAAAPAYNNAPAAVTPTPIQPGAAQPTNNTVGDALPETSRKPPTLYNQPGDSPSNANQDAPRQ